MKRTGTEHALSLILNIESNNYIPVLSSSIGVRVIIHEQGTYPFPATEGFSVPVGFQTDVGISFRKMDRLPAPYGNCDDGTEYAAINGKAYDSAMCLTECVHEQIAKQCNCYVFVQYVRPAFLHDLKKCETDEEFICAIRVEKDHAKQAFDCDCPLSCEETEYLSSTTSSQFPSPGYADVLAKQVCHREQELIKNGVQFVPICQEMKQTKTRYQFMKNNFLAITVYVRHLNYEGVTEEVVYPLINFLADMGGTMSLYCGYSSLTAVELVALATAIVSEFIKRAFRARQANINVIVNNVPQETSPV
jgi:hypothetical protein